MQTDCPLISHFTYSEHDDKQKEKAHNKPCFFLLLENISCAATASNPLNNSHIKQFVEQNQRTPIPKVQLTLNFCSAYFMIPFKNLNDSPVSVVQFPDPRKSRIVLR